MEDKLTGMIKDLGQLVKKGYGDAGVTIYCSNCDCYDKYRGATVSLDSDKGEVIITVNKD